MIQIIYYEIAKEERLAKKRSKSLAKAESERLAKEKAETAIILIK